MSSSPDPFQSHFDSHEPKQELDSPFLNEALFVDAETEATSAWGNHLNRFQLESPFLHTVEEGWVATGEAEEFEELEDFYGEELYEDQEISIIGERDDNVRVKNTLDEEEYFEFDVPPPSFITRDFPLKSIADGTLGNAPKDIRAEILSKGNHDAKALTNQVFWQLHLDLKDTQLKKTDPKQQKLRDEWSRILRRQIDPLIWLHRIVELLDKYRGDIPREFLLGWMAVESDGSVKVISTRGERGYFQIDWKGGEAQEQLKLSRQDFNRLSTDREFSIQIGVQLVQTYRRFLLDNYKLTDGTDLLWHLTKARHGASGTLKFAMDKLVNASKDITWSAVSQEMSATNVGRKVVNNVNEMFRHAALLKPIADLIPSPPVTTPELPISENENEWDEEELDIEGEQREVAQPFSNQWESESATFQEFLDETDEEEFDQNADSSFSLEIADPTPKNLKLVDHFHIPKSLPDGKVGTLTRLTQQNINPGFVSLLTDDLLVDRRADGLQTRLENLIKTKYKQFLATKNSAQERARETDRIRVALVDLTGAKLFNPDLAGWGETISTDGASVPKICALYAVHQLHFDLNHFADKNSITKKEDLIKAAKAAWKKIGFSSMPRIDDLFNFVVLENLSRPVSVIFTPELLGTLTKTFKDNDNCAVDRLISQLGFPYIASVIWQSGLRHPTRGGLWLWGGYCCADKNGIKRLLNLDMKAIECTVSTPKDGLSFRWKENPMQQPKPVFPHNATALSVATYFTFLAQGRLVNDQASKKIAKTLQDACSFFWDIQLGGLSLDPPPTKCGILGNLKHDSILIKRIEGGKEICYAAVALTIGAPDFPFKDFLKDLDKLIQDKN
jgi:hypothetical protein